MRTCHCDWSFIWNRLMSTIVYTLYLFCAYFNVSNKIRIGYSKCKIPMECEFIFFKYIINLKIDIFETCTMINEVWPYLCGSIERCSLFFVCRTISVQRNKKKLQRFFSIGFFVSNATKIEMNATQNVLNLIEREFTT